MPTRNRGQMQRGARIQRAKFLKSNQTQLVHMSAEEFLDYAIKTKIQQGKSQQQAIEWVSNTLSKAKISSSDWEENRESFKNLTSYTSVGLDMLALQALAMDMKRGGQAFSKFQIRRYGGREYVIFEGYPGMRRHLKRSRYWANHPKVVSFGIGRTGLKDLVKGGFVVSILVSAGFQLVDKLLSDKKTWRHFVSALIVDVALAVASAGIAWGAVSLVFGASTAVVVGPLVVAVLVGGLSVYFLGELVNSKALTDMLEDTSIAFEHASAEKVKLVQRDIRRAKVEYQSDPISYLYRLFGIPRPVLPSR